MKKNEPVFDFNKAINLEHSPQVYVALLLGLFFLMVSVRKILVPHLFAEAVFHGHIMPYPLVNIAALIFMFVEFTAAFVIVFMKPWRRAGLWLLIGVIAIYTGCMTANLLRDLNTVCGCFGSHARMAAISWLAVLRNLAIIGAGLFALR